MNRPRTAVSCLLMLLALTTAAAHAQTNAFDRGVWIVGGNGSWTHRHDSAYDSNINSAELFANGGRFVAPGLAVGLTFLMEYNRNKRGAFESRVTEIGAGPSIDAYPGPRTSRVRGHLGIAYLFLHESIREVDRPNDLVGLDLTDRYGISGITARGGGVFLLGRNVGLNVDALYQHSWTHHSTSETVGPLFVADSRQDIYGITAGFTLFLY